MQTSRLRRRSHLPARTGRLAVVGRQAVWFTAIGGALTLAYLVLYLALRDVLGPQPANYLAWALTAIADTAANRRLTFSVADRVGQARAQLEGLLVFALGLALTSAAVAVLETFVGSPGRVLELGVLGGANVAAGVLRFELLRRWVFGERRGVAAEA